MHEAVCCKTWQASIIVVKGGKLIVSDTSFKNGTRRYLPVLRVRSKERIVLSASQRTEMYLQRALCGRLFLCRYSYCLVSFSLALS